MANEEQSMMSMMMPIMMMVVMVGILPGLTGSVIAAPPPAPPAPIPPPGPSQVQVRLQNAPADATKWQFTITDQTAAEALGWGIQDQDNISGVAVFDIPDSWVAPYRVVQLTLYKAILFGGEPANEQLYYMQSWRPFLWDWDLSDWSTDPDPTYRDITIPGPGLYDYDVLNEAFVEVV